MSLQNNTYRTNPDFMFPYQGKLFRRLELGVPGAVLHISASHEDKTIASCSTDPKVLLWDVPSGRLRGTLVGHTSEVTCCSFGDELLATGARDGVVMLWKYKLEKKTSRIACHHGAVHGCAISPDFQYLATVGEDGKAVIFTIRSGEGEFIQGPNSKELVGHEDSINDVVFSADSESLLTCSSDGTIKFWNVETGECRQTIQTGYGKLINAKLTPDSKRVVCLSRQIVSVWDITTGKVEWEATDVDGRGYQSLSLHPSCDMISIVSMDGTMTFQHLNDKDNKILRTSDHKGPILSCNFSPSGGLGMTGGIDGKVLVWV